MGVFLRSATAILTGMPLIVLLRALEFWLNNPRFATTIAPTTKVAKAPISIHDFDNFILNIFINRGQGRNDVTINQGDVLSMVMFRYAVNPVSTYLLPTLPAPK